MTRRRAVQTDLFGAAAAPTGAGATDGVLAAEPSPELQELATRLPASLRLGTSSWAFPGWAGLVYAGTETTSRLSRRGLGAYAQHPLLRTVGIDRTFYAPIPAADFAAYADQVPTDFRFLVKAHADLTTPGGLRMGKALRHRGPISDRYLDAAYAAQEVVGPAIEGLGTRLGVLLFQFPPLAASSRQLRDLPEALGRFLSALPPGVPYAVEVRNRSVLGPSYVASLRAGNATHCYTVHPSMPGVLEQRAQLGEMVDEAGTVVVRWMLRPDQQYEAARDAYAPFHDLAAPDLTSRAEVATLLRGLLDAGRSVIVIANNKAEGSAPRTLTELARQVASTGTSPAAAGSR